MGGYTRGCRICLSTFGVICLQISNFEWVDTPTLILLQFKRVVICLQISNFEWVDTPKIQRQKRS